MAKLTREEYIENWLDKYEQAHPNEKLDYEALREQADCEWFDNEVDHDGAKTEFDLTAEQEKVSQDARKGARAVDAYGKTHKRERKPNEDKREIISALTDGLLSYLTDENGNPLTHAVVANVERQIDFEWKGTHYSVTLTAHRPPKAK